MVCSCPGKNRFPWFVAFVAILPLLISSGAAQLNGWSPVDSGYFSTVQKINANMSAANTNHKKSVGRAFFYSLLIPGLGEAYSGHSGYAKFFLTVEATGWGIYLANHLTVASRMEDYKNYAVHHASVNRSGKTAQYWIDIGKYNTIYDYNEQKRRERDVAGIYVEDAQNFWRWDSYNNRLYYDWKRIQTRELERNQIFIIGGLMLNHLVSAINAIRLARAYNKQAAATSWNFQLSVNPYHQIARLNFYKTF
jgi:hypothetical protein